MHHAVGNQVQERTNSASTAAMPPSTRLRLSPATFDAATVAAGLTTSLGLNLHKLE